MRRDTNHAAGIASRRLLLLPGVFFLVVATLPWISDYAETGGWPRTAPQFTTEIIGSGVALLLGGWILTLIHREQRNALRHLAELERLTLIDPLTGLGNRRALERDLALALGRSERLGAPAALLYMDVDRFKQLNDRYGHAAGDETLRTLGAVLRSCSRAGTDTAYRVGGDEFVMTLVADSSGAERLAERVKREFAQRSPRGSRLSLGIVVWDGRAGVSELLDQADSRMYQSKFPGWARRA